MTPATNPMLLVVLPLAALSAAGLLALDLVLPALPAMALELGAGTVRVQAVVSAYLVGVAVSQLLWGALVARFGVWRAASWGLAGMAACALWVATDGDIDRIVVARALQGLAAGMTTVVVATTIRHLLRPDQQTRALAVTASVESLAPALGPVLGWALLELTGWRGQFVALAALAVAGALAAAPVLTRVPRPARDRDGGAGYATLAADPAFVRPALAHASSLGTLLGVVVCAPHLFAGPLKLGVEGFVAMQMVGVASFIAGALVTARATGSAAAPAVVLASAWGQVLVMLGLASLAAVAALTPAGLIGGWGVFCLGMGLRGPPTLQRVLARPAGEVPRAAALTMASTLAFGAVTAQLGAWLLAQAGPGAMFAAAAVMLMPGALLVRPPSTLRPRQHMTRGVGP